jgi:hypothetical protein
MKLALWKDRREASIEAIRKSMHSLEGHRRTTTTIEFEVEQGDENEIGDVGELMKTSLRLRGLLGTRSGAGCPSQKL